MRKVKFQVEGVDGDFVCDADALTSYHTLKQLAMSDRDPAGMFDALGRIFAGQDEEYVERVGGMGNLKALMDAATGAVRAKNSSASSRASRGAVTK